MYHPTTRVLAVLELLQTHGRMTGTELSQRLEVDIRTARRYITMLQDLGIPVIAERGRHGAYMLGPGFKLPPMMFTDDEALALSIGLLAARQLGLADSTPAVASAQAKLERVMPVALKGRVRALTETITLNLNQVNRGAASVVMLTLSGAALARRRVHLHYRAEQGGETERDFDPYGLTFREGCWYAAGHCHLRNDLRLFRLDRVIDVAMRDERFERPADFNVLAHVNRSIATLPRRYPVKVWIDAPMEEVQCDVPEGAFLLEPFEQGVMLHGRTDNPDWLARFLARLSHSFRVIEPPELLDSIRQHAARLIQMIEVRSEA